MNTRKMRMVALVLAVCLSGTAQAALQGRDLNGSIDSFEAYYDTVLDITWLADANYGAGSIYDDDSIYEQFDSTTDGRMSWVNANAWTANLSFTDGVNTYDDWRLPTVNLGSTDGNTNWSFDIISPNSELVSMYYVNLVHLGINTPAISDCNTNSYGYCIDNIDPFSNLQLPVYWTDTEYTSNTDSALVVSFLDGMQFDSTKTFAYNAWAVSNGDVGIAAVPEPETYAMMLAGLGLVGAASRRRRG
jgi:hypothetical protein